MNKELDKAKQEEQQTAKEIKEQKEKYDKAKADEERSAEEVDKAENELQKELNK